MPLHLIVKGNRYEAAQAATRHRIPFVFCRETAYGETCGITSARFWSDVSGWFIKDATHKAPYAVGALLHYNEVSEAD